jgi:hypothetical protein
MWYFATVKLHNNNNSIKDKPPLTCKTCCPPSLLIATAMMTGSGVGLPHYLFGGEE